MSMLETILATAARPRAFGFLWGFGLVRFVIGLVVVVVFIWLLLKVAKLVDAYTKKLK